MQYINKLSSLLRILQLIAVIQLSAVALGVPAPVAAQTVVPVEPFRSIELRGGGTVIINHGPTQGVTVLKGSLDYTRFKIADGRSLVIDRCDIRCPRGYDLQIEIVTPDIVGLLVTDGGTIQIRAGFPPKTEIEAAVRDGGAIDIRSMVVDRVTASVKEGGVILTIPQIALSASVVNGGTINYWGDAHVESSVRSGGDISKGAAAAANKPLSELSPPLPSPPTPPIPPLRRFL